MVSPDDAVQIVLAGIVVLIGVSSTIAWSPARGRYPGGLSARLFLTAGLVAVAVDPSGLGVLGGVLTAMGLAVWWAGQPDPELPRPRHGGIVTASIVTGLATLATLRGWGVLEALPEEIRLAIAPFVGAIGALGTIAIADRTRVTFRDAMRRRARQLWTSPR